jgi:hypothetical protein
MLEIYFTNSAFYLTIVLSRKETRQKWTIPPWYLRLSVAYILKPFSTLSAKKNSLCLASFGFLYSKFVIIYT